MKSLISIGIYLVLVQALYGNETGSQWELYKKSFGKNYDFEEDTRRYSMFNENLRKIAEHNEKYRRGEFSYKVNINQFTDMFETEMKLKMKGIRRAILRAEQKYVDYGEQIPASIDWRQKNSVTPVKNQGESGSCCVFSVTGAIEGQQALKSGKLVPLSEQNIIDCDTPGYNQRFLEPIYDFVQRNGGIDTEKSYPLTDQIGPCRFNKKTVGAKIRGHIDITEGDETILKSAVAKIGPISVLIDASNWSFQMYSGGVYDEPKCSSTQLDHAALIVGYGTENGKDYWLVKNSWGPQWGEAGYIKMIRNANNQCGIASSASCPLV